MTSLLSCITEICWGLFCLFVSCTTFTFGLYTYVSMWFLYLLYFSIPTDSSFFDCQTEYTTLLNKDREVSFVPFHKLFLFSFCIIVVAHHCSLFCLLCFLVTKFICCYRQYLGWKVNKLLKWQDPVCNNI